jgi:Flp pilus assembly protein TadD
MKRTLLSSLLAAGLLFGLAQHHSVTTAGVFDWSTLPFEEPLVDVDADADADENEDPASEPKKKKKGNGFVRAISAPFRAFGRLFGGGSKKNEQQATKRSSSKDASKFESVNVTRIKDARSDAQLQDSTSSGSDAAQPNGSLQNARELISAGNLDAAIAELSTLASLNPSDAEVQNLLGVAFEGKGFRHRALQSFYLAVRLDDDNAQYLNNYGFLLYKNGDLETATKYLRRAAKRSPRDPRIWNNLGLTLSQRGKFNDAYESFARAVGPFHGHLNVAVKLQERGHAKDAIKHLEKAQALRPNSIDVLSKLVSLYEMTGRISDAETARRSLVVLKTFADANK